MKPNFTIYSWRKQLKMWNNYKNYWNTKKVPPNCLYTECGRKNKYSKCLFEIFMCFGSSTAWMNEKELCREKNMKRKKTYLKYK